MDTDQSLLTRYHQQGDASAFQDLVRAHGGMVFATARRITQDAALAEEVVQEVFLTLARRDQDIRGSVAAWLHQVAKQKACNVIRGESRRRHYEQAAAPGLHTTPESTWAEIEPLVDEALAELPEPVRGLLIEHYLERRTQADIAKRLGLNQSTVSRQLESGLQLLRDSLRRKGVICGASLGALLLEGTAATTVPATLTASLLKMGLSGIGSQTAALASASTATTITALKLKVAAALLGVLAIGWVASDLASQESRLARWFGAKRDVLAAADARSRTAAKDVSTNANTHSQEERWTAEAREIWANVGKFGQNDVARVRQLFLPDHGHDADQLFAALGSIGITLSRATFDRLMADHLRARRALARSDLWMRVIETWVSQMPREALAWTYGFQDQGEPWEFDVCYFFLKATDAIRLNPEAWTAFLAVSPDPAKLTALSGFGLRTSDDPSNLWSEGAALGLNSNVLEAAASHYITTAEPATVLQMLAHCPDPDFKHRALLRLTPRLRSDQLLGLAEDSAGELANFLRAMAGSADALFSEAVAFARATAKKDGWDVIMDIWSAECVEKIYSHWVKANPGESLDHALDSKNQDHLERFMVEAAQSGSLSEESLAAVLAGRSVSQTDSALAAFYRAQADGDPSGTLNRISASAFITDQIEAAKAILKEWSKATPEGAAQWLQSLPPSEDHTELAKVIVSEWVNGDAKAAIAFAREQGLALARFSGALAFGLCDDSDAVVAPLLRTFREDPEYNRLVVLLAGYRLGKPEKAFGFIAAHGNPGWQTEAVRSINHMLKVNDSRAEDFSLALPTQNLSSVPPGQLVTLAERLVSKLQKSDRLPQALDWTLKLPSAIAPQARAAAIGQLVNFKPAQRRQIDQWLTRAPLDAAEREALRQHLAQQAVSAGMP